jgi:hypothetical protein
MQRSYFFISLLILLALLTGCAPESQAQVKGLEAATATSLPEASPTAETKNLQVVPRDPPASCPISRPPHPAFVPPAPYPSAPLEQYVNEFWYGTPELWTMLGTEGTWYGLPQDEQGYSQKVFWWRQASDVRKDSSSAFTVTLERLDVKSSPIVTAEHPANASADFGTAMLTGVVIPAPGCWKVTGQYQGDALSFVVWVAP